MRVPGKAMDEKDETPSGSAVETPPGAGAGKRVLSPAALRALAEAEERRRRYDSEEAARPREIGGRGGKDPNRYGDWEIKGLTSDF